MNREQRRKLNKIPTEQGQFNKMDTPCTISECVQISRASAQDVVEEVIREYSRDTQPQVIATSLQVDVLRQMLFDSGVLDEEEFKENYAKKATEFNELQKKYKESIEARESGEIEEDFDQLSLYEEENQDNAPKLEVLANDVEIQKERRDE